MDAPDIPSFSNLGAGSGRFVGRDEDLRRAVESVGDSVTPRKILLIGGVAGIGKTEFARRLARELAHRLGREAPDLVFACIRFAGAGEDELRTLLADLLRSRKVDEKELPSSLGARSGRWRAEVAGRLVVLLLDNVIQVGQVGPFLPADSDHVVLITSRKRLSGLKVDWPVDPLPLEALPPPAAEALIRQIAGRELDDERDRDEVAACADLAAFCAYHPLAIKIAVLGLRDTPVTLAERLADLREESSIVHALGEVDEGEISVAKTFARSYEELRPQLRVLLQRLAVAPVPAIGPGAAAALMDAGVRETRRQLDALTEEGLIEGDGAEYRLHDLVRQFARSLAERGDTTGHDAAVERLLAYYHRIATQTDAILTRQPYRIELDAPASPVPAPFADAFAGVAWARDHLDELRACAEHAHRDDSDRGRRWTIRFGLALAGLLRNEGQWTASHELQTRAIAAAEALALPLAAGYARHERGQLNRLLDRLDEATDDLLRAQELFRGATGEAAELGAAHVLNTLAVVLDRQRRREEAAATFRAALAAYERLDDRRGRANVWQDLGMFDFFASPPDYAGAAGQLARALALYQEAGPPLGEAHAHINLARTMRRLGLDGEAAEHLEAAQAIYGRLGNRLGRATLLRELGSIAPDPQRKLEALTDALRLSRELKDRSGEAAALIELGVVHGASGRPRTAEENLRHAYRILHDARITRDLQRPVDELRRLGIEPGADPGQGPAGDAGVELSRG
ncbi:hypothetical protein [Dactylosporangium sp. NPDC051541]|uniref:hypothetical protein n=1 Tax=Dactylosporangium sp. NPDC051541 TaxID=3363977 RepID=UPI00379044CC